MAIKTTESINGFIASEPRLTHPEGGQARFYARIGINHFRREEDGSFTESEPTYHDLIQFGRGAELSAERFRKGDKFLAQGHVRDYTHLVDGEERTDQQFVTNRLAHDPNLTTYNVHRRPHSERETPAVDRDAASCNGTRAATEQAVVSTRPSGRSF